MPRDLGTLAWASDFVSVHRLVADTGEEQVRLWWDTFAIELAAAARDQHVLLLMDANASLGKTRQRRSARIRAEAVTGSSRALWHLGRELSGPKKGERPKASGSHRS